MMGPADKSPATALTPAQLIAQGRTICGGSSPVVRPSSENAERFASAYRRAVGVSIVSLAGIMCLSRVLANEDDDDEKDGASLRCDDAVPAQPVRREKAESMVSVNELAFGSTIGICVGIFGGCPASLPAVTQLAES